MFVRLTDPRLILAGTIGGALLGALVPEAGRILQPFGRLYIAALSIAVLPLMITALVSGTGGLLRSVTLRRTFRRFAVVYLLTLLVPCAAAFLVGWLLQPGGDLSAEAAASLGRKLVSATEQQNPEGLIDFLASVIPSNIFHDLAAGNIVAIVLFSILLGIALGLVETPGAAATIDVVRALFEAFSRVFEWILRPLALGIFCLMAGIASTVSLEMLEALTGFLIAFYCAGALLIIVYTLALIGLRRLGGLRSLLGLRSPLIISFVANNPFIALRPAVTSAVDRLEVDEEIAKTVIPFGIVAAQHGQIINIILLTMFLANLYGIDLTAGQIATLAIGGTVAGTAVVGGGATLAPVIAPILASVGVPGDLAIVVLASTEQIVGPLLSLLTVYAAITVCLLGRPKPATPAQKPSAPQPAAPQPERDTEAAR